MEQLNYKGTCYSLDLRSYHTCIDQTKHFESKKNLYLATSIAIPTISLGLSLIGAAPLIALGTLALEIPTVVGYRNAQKSMVVTSDTAHYYKTILETYEEIESKPIEKQVQASPNYQCPSNVDEDTLDRVAEGIAQYYMERKSLNSMNTPGGKVKTFEKAEG